MGWVSIIARVITEFKVGFFVDESIDAAANYRGGLSYDRCRKCEADLNLDIEVGRTTCFKCGKRIKKAQIKKWHFHNPK